MMPVSLVEQLFWDVWIAAQMRTCGRLPYLAREEIQARRDAGVRRIVAYASETAPLYLSRVV